MWNNYSEFISRLKPPTAGLVFGLGVINSLGLGMCFRYMKTSFKNAILFVFFYALSATAIADDGIYTLKRLHAEGWTISEPLIAEDIEQKSLNEIQKERKINKDIPLLPFGFKNEQWLGFKKSHDKW